MKILVTGSLAYDTIMVFPDRFRNHLLADQLHILNVCFLTPELRREYGGTAGNIGYNLRLLGEDPIVMATAGEDIEPDVSRVKSLGLSSAHLKRIPGQFTAQGFITTDLDNNQITNFHPGAMNFSHENRIGAALGAGLAIIGPDGKLGMVEHARQCAEQRIPFLFDPGQGLPMFSGEELGEFIRLADYVAVNDYEGKLLQEKTGRSLDDVSREVKALVYTRGAEGSTILAAGQRHQIDPVEADQVVDPTGCGDAYRAGLLYGIARGLDWPTTGRLGSVMGAIKIAHRGGQNHAPAREEIEARFKRAFGYSPWKGGSCSRRLAESRPDLVGVLGEPLPRWVLHRPGKRHAVAVVARHEVDMQVHHRLARGGAVRLIHREPRRLERAADRARHRGRGSKHRRGLRIVQREDVLCVLFHRHQHMPRVDLADIHKRKRVLVLVHHRGRDLLRNDLAKHTVRHHSPPASW